MIARILSIASAGSALASLGLLSRFLSGVANMMVLAIVSAFLLCTLLGGGLLMTYAGLVHFGLDPFIAGLGVGGMALILAAIAVFMTLRQLENMSKLLPSGKPAGHQPTGIPEVASLVDAFVEGFLHPRR